MKKKLTKTLCLLSLVSLPTILALSFIDGEQQNKQELQNNRIIGVLANSSNSELIDKNGIIDKPFYILNYAADQKNSIDIYLYGDGYTKTELEEKKLYNKALVAINTFFSYSQYRALKNYMNIYLVFTESNTNGNYSVTSSYDNDTYFRTYRTSRTFGINATGKEKVQTLNNQVKTRISKKDYNYLYRSNVFIDTQFGGGKSFNKEMSLTSSISNGTFVHEMSHNFSLDDEYQEGNATAHPNDINRTPYNDPNKVQWREFLGYRNIGIYKAKNATKDFLIPYVSDSKEEHLCKMKLSSSSILCEVCKWKSFQFVNNSFENKLDYVGFPSITTSYNSGNYQKHREELVDEQGQHNTREIQNSLNENIDLRTVFYNAKDKAQEIKLKLTIRDKLTKAENITEEIFLIQPNQIKQLRLTSKSKLNSANVELIGEVIDVATSKVLATSQNYWREPKKLVINFLDNNSQKIDFISQQTYEYYDDDFVDNFQGQDLVGYKLKSKTMSKNGNDTILDLIYEPLNFKEITMNLYDSVDLQIRQTKQWKIFEGETFTTSKYDFLLPNDAPISAEIIYPTKTISYNQLASNSSNIVLNYLIGYDSSTWEFKVKEQTKTIKLGNDSFDVFNNVVIKTKTKDDKYVENKYYTMQEIVIDEGNFNPYKVGRYDIRYKYGNSTSNFTVVVEDDSSLDEKTKQFINDIENITKNPIVLNNNGKNVDINQVTKDNIQSYVNNWPQSYNGVSVELEKFEPIVENALAHLTFKFTKNSLEKRFKTSVRDFKSAKKELNEVIKELNLYMWNNISINEEGRKTHIREITNENIKQYVSGWPKEEAGFKFEGFIEEKSNNYGWLTLRIKVTKDNISKISDYVTIHNFLTDGDIADEQEYPNNFQILHNIVKQINIVDLRANNGSEIMASEITIENLQQNIANFPTIDNLNINVSIDFLAISDKENGGAILVKYKLTLNDGDNGTLVLYSDFKEIKGFKPDENLMMTINERNVKAEVKRLNEDPPKVNNKGKDTYVKDVPFDFGLNDCIDNYPKKNSNLFGITRRVKEDRVNGVIELYWEIWGDDPTAAIYIENTNTFKIDGFKPDPNGIQPPENNDLNDVNEEVNKINNTQFLLNDTGKNTHISQVTEKNIQNYVDNWPTSNKGVLISVKSGSFSKNTKNGSVSFVLKLSKNNVSVDSKQITIVGFKVDQIQPPNTNDQKDVDNAINELKNNPPKINDIGKNTHISQVTEKNIQNYVDNWPQNSNGITWTFKFTKNEEKNSIEIRFTAQKGSASNSISFTIDGFNKNQDGDNKPKPPINPDDSLNSTSSNKSLPIWAIVLISISSLVGVGLVGFGIWWFVRKKRYL